MLQLLFLQQHCKSTCRFSWQFNITELPRTLRPPCHCRTHKV